MTSQVVEGTNTQGRDTLSGFLTRCKDPAIALLTLVVLLSTFGSGFIAGAAWFVDPKVQGLRGELTRAIDTTNAELAALRNETQTSNKRTDATTTTLNDRIEENSDRISDNGERIAGMKAALAGTSDRVDRLHTQVTKNSEGIVEVRMRGTPD